MDIDLSNWPQPSFEPVFNSHARYLVVFGGASAGKSFAVSQKLITKALIHPNSRIIAIRQYGPSHDISCWRFFCEHIEEKNIPCIINKTSRTITFPNKSTIQCLSIVHTQGETTERIKSLTDVTDIWLEEASNDINPTSYEMIRMRLRGQPLKDNYRQMILTFNPIDQNNWTNKYFPLMEFGVHGDVEVQHYTYKDNDYLDEENKRELEGLKDIDPNLYKVYTLGVPGSLENQVYTNFKRELFAYNYDDFETTIGGVDFGWEHPSAFVLLGIKEKEIYVIDELYLQKKLNSEFIEAIKDKLDEHITDPRLHNQIPLYCDTAEPARIAEMRNAGLNVHAAKKDVLDGINAVRQYKFKINPRAEHFFKEIQGYVRQKDRDGNVQELPDKQRGFDDLMDATRYAVYTWTRGRGGGLFFGPVIVGEGEGTILPG
jgi:phage terminase large subunit